MVAQSLGAVLAATWAHDYAPDTAVCARLAGVQGEAVCTVRAHRAEDHARVARNFFVNSYVKARFLTHDPERIRSYEPIR